MTHRVQVAIGLTAAQEDSRQTSLFGMGLALLAAAAAVGLAAPVLMLFRLIPRTYNEGWNAFWADTAMRHGQLYGPAESLVSNNYPPLSFQIVGLLGHVVGDNVIAGRIVSLLSLTVVTGAAYLWLRATGSARQIAFAGATLCLVTFAFYGTNYVAMNDPQLLAHAFMLSALVVMWRWKFSMPATIAGAALMLLGGFTKHLLLPVPLAMTLWLVAYQPRRLPAWLGCFAVGLPLGFWLTSHFYGELFFQDLLSARLYSAPRAISSTIHACVRFIPLLALAAIPVVRRMRTRGRASLADRTKFALLYLVLSIVIGAVAAGGEGVTRNAFFDVLIAASLCAALGLESLQSSGRPRQRARAAAAARIVAFLGIGMAIYATITLPETIETVRGLDAAEQETRESVRVIAQLGHGHAACETLALCYWARGGFNVDFFNYGQKMQTGMLPVAECRAALQRGTFPVLQLENDHPPLGKRLWPCTPAIDQFYTVAFRSKSVTILVPKPASTS